MKRLLGEIRRADETYHLIAPGDHVAVGVSGGKDSMALMMLLGAYRQFAPHSFFLSAITLKLGDPFDTAPLQALCEKENIPLHIHDTGLLPTLEKGKNPCSLCARIRRGALSRIAGEMGCNKLALGHHREDVLETYLMSALHEGRFYHLAPKAPMERAGVILIRPLIDAREAEIIRLANRLQLPVIKNPCPVDGQTKRSEMKALLTALERKIPGANDQLCAALRRAREDKNALDE